MYSREKETEASAGNCCWKRMKSNGTNDACCTSSATHSLLGQWDDLMLRFMHVKRHELSTWLSNILLNVIFLFTWSIAAVTHIHIRVVGQLRRSKQARLCDYVVQVQFLIEQDSNMKSSWCFTRRMLHHWVHSPSKGMIYKPDLPFTYYLSKRHLSILTTLQLPIP